MMGIKEALSVGIEVANAKWHQTATTDQVIRSTMRLNTRRHKKKLVIKRKVGEIQGELEACHTYTGS